MPLTQESGGDNNDRVTEKNHILNLLDRNSCINSMTDRELDFILRMEDAIYVSPGQLFWLRDIKDKYL